MPFIIFSYAYGVFLTIVSFFIPATILIATYSRILVVLIKRNSQRDILTDDKDVSGFTNVGEMKKKARKTGSTSERQTRRATIMCFICLATYVLLWQFWGKGSGEKQQICNEPSYIYCS